MVNVHVSGSLANNDISGKPTEIVKTKKNALRKYTARVGYCTLLTFRDRKYGLILSRRARADE